MTSALAKRPDLLPHTIRPAVDGDAGMVLDAWVREYRHAPASRGIRNEDYVIDTRSRVLRILRVAQTIVACGVDAAHHLYGFATFGPGPLLHWIYVKPEYQRIGMGDELLRAAFPDRGPGDDIYATHASGMWWELEPRPDRATLARLRARGEREPEGSLTRRRIFLRPSLLDHVLHPTEPT